MCRAVRLKELAGLLRAERQRTASRSSSRVTPSRLQRRQARSDHPGNANPEQHSVADPDGGQAHHGRDDDTRTQPRLSPRQDQKQGRPDCDQSPNDERHRDGHREGDPERRKDGEKAKRTLREEQQRDWPRSRETHACTPETLMVACHLPSRFGGRQTTATTLENGGEYTGTGWTQARLCGSVRRATGVPGLACSLDDQKVSPAHSRQCGLWRRLPERSRHIDAGTDAPT